jgi:hypothetical protein
MEFIVISEVLWRGSYVKEMVSEMYAMWNILLKQLSEDWVMQLVHNTSIPWQWNTKYIIA